MVSFPPVSLTATTRYLLVNECSRDAADERTWEDYTTVMGIM